MNKRIIMPLVLLIVFSLLLISCSNQQSSQQPASSTPEPATTSQPAKVHEWKMECFMPPTDTEYSVAWQKFADLVDANTDGQVKITLFETGSVVTSAELMNAVRDGILQASVSSPAYFRGAIPVLNVVDGLPFSFQTVEELDELLHDYGLSELTRESLTEYGVHLIGHNAGAGDGLGIMSAVPFSNLDDLNGKIIRTHGSFLDFWTELGLKTVSIPFPEIYTSIATGTIDAVATAWNGMYSLKLYELCNYGMIPNQIGCNTAQLIVNPDAWDALSTDVQDIINDTYYNEWNPWNVNEYAPTRLAVFDEFKAQGVEFVTLPQEDQDHMLEVAIGLWDEAAEEDALCAQAVEILKDYYKQTGRIK